MSNTLSYTNYEFEELANQLISRLQQNSDAWKDTYRSSTGQMLIELFSYVGNCVLYYVERRAEESYLPTAKLRSSIINLTKILNYKVRRPISSSGQFTFVIPTAALGLIIIPKYTIVQSNSGNNYITIEDAVINVGQTSVVVNAIQGTVIDAEVTTDGNPVEYNVPSSNIENSNLFVYVDGDQWTETSSFISSTANSLEYKTKTENDDTVTILSGDGVRGKKPATGSTMLVRYVETIGKAGNIYNVGVVSKLSSKIYDDSGNEVSDVTVSNTTTFLGGSDVQTEEEIKTNAPKVFSTGDRLVTAADYKAEIGNYQGVSSVNVWGEAELEPPNFNQINKVSIALILNDWIFPDTNFKNVLSDHLKTKAQLTVRYEYIDPTLIYVIPVLQVKVSRKFSLSAVQASIEGAIESDFVLGSTTVIGTPHRISAIYNTVQKLDGVSYLYMYFDVKKALTSADTHAFTTTVDAAQILKRTLYVYVADVVVAHDDGTGSFIDDSVDYTVSGTVNYTTGAISVNFAEVVSAPVYVRYQQDANGDVVVSNKQIAKLDSIDMVITFDK